jgi:hypothetical protein
VDGPRTLDGDRRGAVASFGSRLQYSLLRRWSCQLAGSDTSWPSSTGSWSLPGCCGDRFTWAQGASPSVTSIYRLGVMASCKLCNFCLVCEFESSRLKTTHPDDQRKRWSSALSGGPRPALRTVPKRSMPRRPTRSWDPACSGARQNARLTAPSARRPRPGRDQLSPRRCPRSRSRDAPR